MNQDYNTICKNASLFQQQHAFHPVCVAIVDTGIYPHRHLIGKLDGFFDCVNKKRAPYDDNGHGTHVAGIISGEGIFPSCRLFGIKALDLQGDGSISDFLTAMDIILKYKDLYNIRVLNISLGATVNHSHAQKKLLDAVEAIWDCGIVVCAAAGNNGPKKGSVTIPGISRKIITVGTSDDNIPIFLSNPSKVQSHYSGVGPTAECVIKPDILAPGANILSLKNSRSGYAIKSGTSMSTPVISACIALVLSVYPNLTPKQIKQSILKSHSKTSLCFDSQIFFSQFISSNKFLS